MSSEKFNPSNSEYKKVEDLPEEYQGIFVNIPEEQGGGFIMKEALEAYKDFEKLADESNRGRSIFKKIFFVDKKTFADFAREDALRELKKEVNIKEETAYLTKRLFENFKELFKNSMTLVHLMDEEIEVIISEDRKGRLPAEILWRFRDKMREKKGDAPNPIPLIGLRASRSTSEDDIKQQLKNILSRNFKGIAYVTDFIYTQRTIRKIEEAFSEVLESGDNDYSRFAGVAVIPMVVDRNIISFGSKKIKGGFFSTNDGKVGNEINSDTLVKYSGLGQRLNDEEEQIRQEIIENVSDNLVDYAQDRRNNIVF